MEPFTTETEAAVWWTYRELERFYTPIEGEICVYCGAAAEGRDHFLPRLFQAKLYQLGIPRQSYTLPCCGSCNSTALDVVCETIEEKRRYICEYRDKRGSVKSAVRPTRPTRVPSASVRTDVDRRGTTRRGESLSEELERQGFNLPLTEEEARLWTGPPLTFRWGYWWKVV